MGVFSLETNLIPRFKELGIKYRYINNVYDPMTIIVTHKNLDICRVDMNRNLMSQTLIDDIYTVKHRFSKEPYNYNVCWFASTVKNAQSLRKHYLMSQTLIDDIYTVKHQLNFKGESEMDKKLYDVIFNNPATIVFWADGTKTVVKAENEPFDPEKGLAMAIAKKALGNNYGYYDTFKKYVGRYEKKQKKGDK